MALKFPVFLQTGQLRDLPSAADFPRAGGVWHTWEPEQAPAFACGLFWSSLHPVLYSEPLPVSEWTSRTLQTWGSLRVPRFPSGGVAALPENLQEHHTFCWANFLGWRHQELGFVVQDKQCCTNHYKYRHWGAGRRELSLESCLCSSWVQVPTQSPKAPNPQPVPQLQT